jgi:hypothetical protein
VLLAVVPVVDVWESRVDEVPEFVGVALPELVVAPDWLGRAAAVPWKGNNSE